MTDTYKIIRFFRDGRNPRTIKSGLSEKAAQEHCRRDDTSSHGKLDPKYGTAWFDGYCDK